MRTTLGYLRSNFDTFKNYANELCERLNKKFFWHFVGTHVCYHHAESWSFSLKTETLKDISI